VKSICSEVDLVVRAGTDPPTNVASEAAEGL